MTSPSDHQTLSTRTYTGKRGSQVAVIVSGWPRVSETFALNELLALHRQGRLAAVFATKCGDPSLLQPGCRELAPLVEILPDGDAVAQAATVVRRLGSRPIAGVHGYFAHQPAEIAELAAHALGRPFGFSVHALDARKVHDTELGRRARAAAVVVACNADVAGDLERAGASPNVLPHGVDLAVFRQLNPVSYVDQRRDGRPTRLLAVGRLVDKKGFGTLIGAISQVTGNVHLRIVGDGPGLAALQSQIAGSGVAHRVTFVGRLTHAELPSEYAAADVVVVPSVIDTSGDRDGLPNVVLEAMASGRPVIASRVAAIPSAVIDGVTGWLVPPGDETALACAIDMAAGQPAEQRRRGAAGHDHVARSFDLAACSARFCHTLEVAYGA